LGFFFLGVVQFLVMKAAIYARYSTENQREASIEDQVRECERAAKAAGLAVVEHYADKGISGGTAQRPGYQSLLEGARAGRFEVIVVEDISRLWRSNAEYGPRSAELEDLGVHLLTCVGDDTRREGWGVMLAIKSAMAEHARREISYRTRRGLEGRALAGQPTGGRCYGYRNGAVYEPEAAVIRRIYAMAAAGSPQQVIADQLTYEGVPAPKAPRWRQNTICGILRNPRYEGRLVWGSETVKRSARDSKKQRRTPRPGGALVDRHEDSLRIVT
jgi:DNA invertase Pin-like site-specific DNA recombinase